MELIIPCLLGGALVGLIIRMAMNAGKSNAPLEITYPYSKDIILEIIPKAAENCNYNIENIDKLSGTVKIEAGLNVKTFGEYITLQLHPIDEDNTKVVYSSRAKYGRENISKNQSNIERISNAVSIQLQSIPKPNKKKDISVADEITKLKSLYDNGVITEEEFNQQKKKILNN